MSALAPQPAAQSSRILVAETHEPLRTQLQDLFRHAGLQTLCAETSEEALRQAKATRIEVALLDLQLPPPGAMELLARLRNGCGGPRVIALSHDDSADAMLSAVRANVYDYFAQPFEHQLILERVQQALTGEPAEIKVVSARPDWLELLVPCQWQAAERAAGFVGRMTAGLPEQTREAVNTAGRELLMNAVEWGGRLDITQSVRIVCARGSRILLLHVIDPGKGFRMDEVPHAAIGYPLAETGAYDLVRQEKGMRPGGLGLLLVQALADELIFNESRNEVIFVKYLP